MKLGSVVKTVPILTLLFAPAWGAAEIVSAEHALESMGFPADTPSLVRALSEGWPDPVSTAPGQYAMSQTAVRRWNAYEYAIGTLSGRQAAEAVPVLLKIVREPLPDRMINDLLLDIPRSNILADTWEEWDRAAAAADMGLRVMALQAVANANPDAAKVDALRFVAEWKPRVAESLKQERSDESLCMAYGRLCALAAHLGCKEGVDALIELLASTKPDSWAGGHLENFLEAVAGPLFPMRYGMSPEAHAEAVRKWQAWWAAEREGFVAPKTQPPPPREDHYYPPVEKAGKLETARSFLRASTERRVQGGDALVLAHPEAEDWLKANAGHYARELRTLAEDPAQTPELRETAATWYARVGGEKAVKWLRAQVLEMEEVDRNRQVGWMSPSVRIALLRKTWPEGFPKTAQEIIERMRPGADAAALSLLRHSTGPEGPGLVLRHYDALVARYPDIRQTALQVFLREPKEGDELAVVDALRNGNLNDAGWAALMVEKRGMENALPQEARAALEGWRKIPYFTLSVVERDYGAAPAVRRAKATAIAESLTGTDAASAQAYARAYSMMTDFEQARSTPEAEACLAKLKLCVAAYRADRPGESFLAFKPSRE